jgi:hypothetical protein
VDRPPRRLHSFSLARSNTTSIPTFYSATLSAQFRASELHFAAAVLFHSGRARHHRGQPAPAHPRPNQPLRKLPRSLLVLLDHSLPSNSYWNFVSDEAPPPPPSASTVGSSLRALPRHHDPIASTTSSLWSSPTHPLAF